MKYRQFIKSVNGNIAVMTALMVSVIMLGVGVAIDINIAVSAKSKMQDALDASLLAVVSGADEELLDLGRGAVRKRVENFYHQNGGLGNIRSAVLSNVDQTVRLSAAAEFENPLRFGGVIGKKSMPISVATEVVAPLEVSSFSVNLISASGAWDKIVEVVGLDDGEETVIASMNYVSNYLRGNSSYRLSNRGWIDVADYDDVFIRFTIAEDAYNFDEWCVLDGCPNKVFTTLEKTYSDRFFIAGQAVPKNTNVDFKDLVACDQRIEHAWEDGGEFVPDVRYAIRGRCDRISDEEVRITR